MTDDDLDVDEVYRAIFDQAPVWEETFQSGPGMVVAVRDAAVVVARLIRSHRETK